MNGRKKFKESKKAACIDDVLMPCPSTKFIRLAELIPLVTDALKDKSKRYSKRGINCGNLDALVYINLLEACFVPTTPRVLTEELDTESLDIQGWRSVSVLIRASRTDHLDIQNWPAMHAVVLTATPTAPNLIRDRVTKILNEYPGPEGWQEGLFEP